MNLPKLIFRIPLLFHFLLLFFFLRSFLSFPPFHYFSRALRGNKARIRLEREEKWKSWEKERGGGKGRGRDSDPPAAFHRLLPIVDGGSSVIVSIVLETTLSPNPTLLNVPKKVNAARFPSPFAPSFRPGPKPGFDPLLSSRWTKNKNS